MNTNGQTHYLPRTLSHGEQTKAWWAIQPARRLLVFVHGFGGTSTGTWNHFPALLPRQQSCHGCDLIFFGYDGLYKRGDISATRLYEFLDKMMTSPLDIINPLLDPAAQRPTFFCYDRMFIVAHSLGAIVSRRALLNAGLKNAPWLNKIEIVLFAPAHMGANVAQLAAQALNVFFIGRLLAPFMQYKFKALQDLEPGCLTLKQLEHDTKIALRERNEHCHKARRVIHAENDGVVNPNRFCDDPVADVLWGKNHIEICKPSDGSVEPLNHLLDVL